MGEFLLTYLNALKAIGAMMPPEDAMLARLQVICIYLTKDTQVSNEEEEDVNRGRYQYIATCGADMEHVRHHSTCPRMA